MNRGSGDVLTSMENCTSSFNEAPIHESGKFHRPAGRIGARHRRFNEAPIHESGKSSRLWQTKPWHSSFNEAPIHESGK